MNDVSVASESEPPRWSPARWLVMVLLFVGLQAGLLFWVGDAKPPAQGRSVAVPMLNLAGHVSDERLVLSDPTLFALPHRQGFSGAAWLTAPRQVFEPFAWSDSPDFLELPAAQLASEFKNFIASTDFDSPQAPTPPAPALTAPDVGDLNTLPRVSSFQISGDLARRTLLSPPAVQAWTNAEMLTNTLIQLLVDAEGNPVSATLLTSCGLKAADLFALAQARKTRFAPLPDSHPATDLSWGELRFEWFIIPPVTNGLAAPTP